MYGSKNLLTDALREATTDKLWSLVYFALNISLDCFDDPKAEKAEWREIGTYCVTLALISKDGGCLPIMRSRLDPWVIQSLEAFGEAAILPVVDKWLQGEPLPERISEDPREEDAKVRHLRGFVSSIHDRK